MTICVSVNQHLLPPTFPKAAPFPCWPNVIEYFLTTLTSFRAACLLYGNVSNCCQLSTVTHFLSSVSSSSKSNLLERSIVQCVIFTKGNANEFGQVPALMGAPVDEFLSRVGLIFNFCDNSSLDLKVIVALISEHQCIHVASSFHNRVPRSEQSCSAVS